MIFDSKIFPVIWEYPVVKLIDQTILPNEYKFVQISTYQQMADAIKTMIVRGAPAIGVSGAFGVVLGAIALADMNDYNEFKAEITRIAKIINATRPTAVNLSWAINQQIEILENNSNKTIAEVTKLLELNAIKILEDDLQSCKDMGEFGAQLVPKKGAGILTHCNAGALATAGYGTALGVIRSAYMNDFTIRVFADETRPRQQGARLTTWELVEDNIPVTLITDGMCSYFMSKGLIDMVVVGADRIAANGDAANKIGTCTVAIAAKHFNVPFYVAAPLSTIDVSIKSGAEIEIEERGSEEVTHINGDWVCAKTVKIINPGFDVTPAELITGIITEKGVLRPDYNASITSVFSTIHS